MDGLFVQAEKGQPAALKMVSGQERLYCVSYPTGKVCLKMIGPVDWVIILWVSVLGP